LPKGWFGCPFPAFGPDYPLLVLDEDDKVLFYEAPDIAEGPFILISGSKSASNLNYSIL
jgi:hypothetical protein